MLKLPLNKDITLIAVGNSIFTAKIIFAGKSTLKLKNIKQRIYLNDVDFKEYYISDNLIFDRSKILGYIPINNNHNNIAEVIQLKRQQIPRNWHNDLLKFIITQICHKHKLTPKVFEFTGRMNRVVFDTEHQCKVVESEFSKAFIPLMNMYIEKVKSKNPDDYNRNLVASTEIDGEIFKAWI